MPAGSPYAIGRARARGVLAAILCALASSAPAVAAGGAETARIQPFQPGAADVPVVAIGPFSSPVAPAILGQVRVVPYHARTIAPVLMQGATLAALDDAQRQLLRTTYRSGYSVVLLGASLHHIRSLHTLLGEGLNYRSKDGGMLLAYALRKENHAPTATLVTRLDRSPLQTARGDPDPTGLRDEEAALARAIARTLTELTRAPRAATSRTPVRDPNGQVDWTSAPIQTTTFAISSPQGVYNTAVNVYALYRCIDQTDHYAVTAEADWTATNAKWQGATSETPNPTMTQDAGGNLVVDWQDNRTYCSSPGFFYAFQDVCRYVNYPLSYSLAMVPRYESQVVQLNAAPGGTQGQQTSYSSGLSFSVGGTVNVSAQGPAAGISAGATWSNITQTTVPPLIVEAGNTANEGARWTFKYCTTGLEPDPGTNCTSHVQMVKDVCQAQLGDDSGTNPQQGQTPVGKFSNAIQSVHWQTATAARTGATFDIEVDFTASTAVTIAHLNNNASVGVGPDTVQGCNGAGCACVSQTQLTPVTKSFTFEVPFPSTKCN